MHCCPDEKVFVNRLETEIPQGLLIDFLHDLVVVEGVQGRILVEFDSRENWEGSMEVVFPNKDTVLRLKKGREKGLISLSVQFKGESRRLYAAKFLGWLLRSGITIRTEIVQGEEVNQHDVEYDDGVKELVCSECDDKVFDRLLEHRILFYIKDAWERRNAAPKNLLRVVSCFMLMAGMEQL